MWSPQSHHMSPPPPIPLEGTLARALPAPVCSQQGPWVGVPHVTRRGWLEVPGWPAASLSEWGAQPTW